MWIIQLTLVVVLASAGWALTPEVVNIPADGKLVEGKYVIYDKTGVEKASILVTADMLRTGEENNLRMLHTLLNKYFDKQRDKYPINHGNGNNNNNYNNYNNGGNNPYYVYGPGNNGNNGNNGNRPGSVTVVNEITQEHGSTHNTGTVINPGGATVVPPGTIVIDQTAPTDHPSRYPVHHHHGQEYYLGNNNGGNTGNNNGGNNGGNFNGNYPGNYHGHYPEDNYPNRPYRPYRPNRPNRPDYPDHHYYPERYDPDRYPGGHHHHYPDRDGDRDHYPYDRYPHVGYPYGEYNAFYGYDRYNDYNGYNGYNGNNGYYGNVGPDGRPCPTCRGSTWSRLRSAAPVTRGFFPVYVEQLAKPAFV